MLLKVDLVPGYMQHKEGDVPDQSLTLYTFNINGLVPLGESLLVEIFLPNGDISDTVQNRFVIGSNTAGQTAPNYFRVPDPACGFPDPIDVATWGGKDMHLVMSVTGDEVVPVELTSFTAQAGNDNVILNWSTATELNNQGFEVERRTAEGLFVTLGSV